ncbi:uncharacterized protein DS421_20g680060 [Arachis hypogaea]|nr:uncharacterized protein DS421_20g680060 [Arachis hypogaea]
MERQGATGSRIRTRSSSVNTRTDAASDARSAEPFECVTIEYTKGDVEGLGCRGVVPLLHLLIQKRFYLLLCEFNGKFKSGVIRSKEYCLSLQKYIDLLRSAVFCAGIVLQSS